MFLQDFVGFFLNSGFCGFATLALWFD